jgi:hypothetical protein
MAKPKTNQELMFQMMNFSPYGALAEAFIVGAVRAYADKIAQDDPAKHDCEAISGEVWVGVAKDISRQMKEFYKE